MTQYSLYYVIFLFQNHLSRLTAALADLIRLFKASNVKINFSSKIYNSLQINYL
jgi:hypothetical protein